MKDKKKINPLLLLWNILGTTGGVISLSSMVQDWVSNLIKWKGFIFSLIESYRQIVHPLFEFLFQWLPFNIPYWIHDYLVFGTIVAVSEFRAQKLITSKIYLPDLIFIFVFVLFWPIVVIQLPKRIYLYHKRKRRPTFVVHNPEIEHAYWAALWMAAIILGSVILLSINTIL